MLDPDSVRMTASGLLGRISNHYNRRPVIVEGDVSWQDELCALGSSFPSVPLKCPHERVSCRSSAVPGDQGSGAGTERPMWALRVDRNPR